MPFLVSKQTADWIRRAMGRGETFGSRPRPAPHLARERPMPFDCQIRRVDNNGDTETHLFCYVPNRNGLVRVAGGSVTATFCGDTAKIDNDWLDLGEAEKGDSATLYLLAPSSASTLAEKLAAACWDVKIGSAPTGSYTVIGPPAPSVLLAEWTEAAGSAASTWSSTPTALPAIRPASPSTATAPRPRPTAVRSSCASSMT